MAKGYSTHDRQGDALSVEQRRCMNYVRRNGNVLVRFPGGFWAMPGTDHPVVAARTWFRTVTVQSLVKRGQLGFTKMGRRRDNTVFGCEARTPRAAAGARHDPGPDDQAPEQQRMEL